MPWPLNLPIPGSILWLCTWQSCLFAAEVAAASGLSRQRSLGAVCLYNPILQPQTPTLPSASCRARAGGQMAGEGLRGCKTGAGQQVPSLHGHHCLSCPHHRGMSHLASSGATGASQPRYWASSSSATWVQVPGLRRGIGAEQVNVSFPGGDVSG